MTEIVNLTRTQCLELLHPGGVGVVAFDRGYGPELLPVTYGANDETLMFRTGTTSRLAREADGHLVAFETHGLEPAMRDGWSVVVRGTALVTTGDSENAAAGLAVEPWAPGEHGVAIRISLSLSQVTGRQLRPATGHPAVF
jgi:nitroimidazol reductase NimA-like FMN-containing flavoprotein (pyridoxamine 5'-phosphate oxidase superfamily)